MVSGSIFLNKGKFTNFTNNFSCEYDFINRKYNILNGALIITSNGYSYNTTIYNYGYVTWSGSTGNNYNSLSQTYSIFVDGRIRWSEINIQWWKHIKNIICDEWEINYEKLKNEFINIKFKNYWFKNDEKNIPFIGLIADELNEINYFKKYVNNYFQCDYDNINLKCYIVKIENNKYKIITNEILEINNVKIKIILCENERIIYTFLNDKILTLDLENDKYDIIIIGWELNIMSINKIALLEMWMYLLKNHLIEYENDKKKFINLNESKNIITEWYFNEKINELKFDIDDIKQSFIIMNKRTLKKWDWENKLNVIYDDLIKKNDWIIKQNNLLMNMYTELKKSYEIIIEDNKNIKCDISKIYDILNWKTKTNIETKKKLIKK